MSTPVEPDMLNSRMSCRKKQITSLSDTSEKSARVFGESAWTILQDSTWVCLKMGYTSETKRRIPNDGNYDDVNIGFDY